MVYGAVKDLLKGAYTTPLQSNDGLYAIFYVNDKRAVKLPTFDEAKQGLAQDLQTARIDQAVAALYQKADIKSAN